MTYTQWINRPVYKAHCATFKIALELCGIPALKVNEGYATRGDTSPITLFRAFGQYRTPEANALRKRVADAMHSARAALKG